VPDSAPTPDPQLVADFLHVDCAVTLQRIYVLFALEAVPGLPFEEFLDLLRPCAGANGPACRKIQRSPKGVRPS
jgi:hypothetical protein